MHLELLRSLWVDLISPTCDASAPDYSEPESAPKREGLSTTLSQQPGLNPKNPSQQPGLNPKPKTLKP